MVLKLSIPIRCVWIFISTSTQAFIADEQWFSIYSQLVALSRITTITVGFSFSFFFFGLSKVELLKVSFFLFNFFCKSTTLSQFFFSQLFYSVGAVIRKKKLKTRSNSRWVWFSRSPLWNGPILQLNKASHSNVSFLNARVPLFKQDATNFYCGKIKLCIL